MGNMTIWMDLNYGPILDVTEVLVYHLILEHDFALQKTCSIIFIYLSCPLQFGILYAMFNVLPSYGYTTFRTHDEVVYIRPAGDTWHLAALLYHTPRGYHLHVHNLNKKVLVLAYIVKLF